MHVIRDLLIDKEMIQKASVYKSCLSSHRHGLLVQAWLLDLLNEAAGYTEMYYQGGTVQRISAAKVKQRDVKPGMLIIQGAETLYRMKGPDMMPQTYMDNIILRLKPVSDKWVRNHFPVAMVVTGMHQYFKETIYQDMDENSVFSFPTVELNPNTQLSKTQWEHRLNKVFCHSALKTQLDSGEVDNQLLLALGT